MDDLIDGKLWARAVVFVVCLIGTIVAIWIGFGFVWIDPFDAFN